jgi:hypothetical protein
MRVHSLGPGFPTWDACPNHETLERSRCLIQRGDERRKINAFKSCGAWSGGFSLFDFGFGEWFAGRHLRVFEGTRLAAASPAALVLGHCSGRWNDVWGLWALLGPELGRKNSWDEFALFSVPVALDFISYRGCNLCKHSRHGFHSLMESFRQQILKEVVESIERLPVIYRGGRAGERT